MSASVIPIPDPNTFKHDVPDWFCCYLLIYSLHSEEFLPFTNTVLFLRFLCDSKTWQQSWRRRSVLESLMGKKTWCRFQPSAHLLQLCSKTSSWCSTSSSETAAGQTLAAAIDASFLFWFKGLIACSVCVCRFADDYRVALQKSYAWTNQAADVPDAQGFIVRPRNRRQNVRVKAEVLTLSFWCLNPAVVRQIDN